MSSAMPEAPASPSSSHERLARLVALMAVTFIAGKPRRLSEAEPGGVLEAKARRYHAPPGVEQ